MTAAARRAAPLLALTVLALGIRLAGIGRENLWIDEVNSVTVATGPPLEVVSRMQARGEAHPPLFYFLLSAWIGLFGNGDTAVRVPGAIEGALTVPLAALLARAAGASCGWHAALLTAVSPLLVAQGQDARMYPLLTLLATLATALWLKDAPGHAGKVLLALATAGMLLTHFSGLFLGATLGALALVWPGLSLRQRAARAAPLLAGLLLFAPWLAVMADQWATTQKYFGWNRTAGLALQVLRLVPYAVVGDEAPPGLAGRAVQALAAAALVAGAAVLVSGQNRQPAVADGGGRAPALQLVLAMVLPVAAIAAIAWLSTPLFHRRYFGFLGVPAAVLAGEGCRALGGWLSRLRIPHWAPLLAFAVVLTAVDGLALTRPRHVDIRSVATWLDDAVRPGDTIVQYAPDGLPQEGFLLLRHYRPQWTQCMVASGGRAFNLETAGYVGDACVVPDLATALAGRDRVLVVMSGLALVRPDTAMEALHRDLPSGWRVKWQRAAHLTRLVEVGRS